MTNSDEESLFAEYRRRYDKKNAIGLFWLLYGALLFKIYPKISVSVMLWLAVGMCIVLNIFFFRIWKCPSCGLSFGLAWSMKQCPRCKASFKSA
ncbi:MAG TPA: hypothetical protein VLT17_12070 [Gemmatimonadales bacterium]|jgi:rubrerythrin|nr:hypothetical protein [Gemmatimonadales bacterium]